MPILELKNITKSFGGLTAVNDVSLSLNDGDILGIVGPNGSGKTTLFNLISGNLKVSNGSIRFKNEDVTKQKTYKRVLKGINRTFQVVRPFSSLTVFENVKVGCLSNRKSNESVNKKVMQLIESVGLKGLENEESQNLPLGNLKKLEIARSLSTDPDLLLLDEPFGGLSHAEITEEIQLIKRINSKGVTVIIVEHVMSALVKLIKNVAVLNFGEIIGHGPLIDIMRDQKIIDAYLGDDYVEN